MKRGLILGILVIGSLLALALGNAVQESGVAVIAVLLAGIFASTETTYKVDRGIWSSVTKAELPETLEQFTARQTALRAHERQVSELRIAHRVVFTGRRDDIPAVTAALEIAVLPSYREAQGLTILEAMALRRPVVASAVGGIPEMIEDGLTGLLVPPRDPEALATAIVRLLRDHSLADTLGRAGHDMVHDRFCIELMVKAIERIYDRGARCVRLTDAAAS